MVAEVQQLARQRAQRYEHTELIGMAIMVIGADIIFIIGATVDAGSVLQAEDRTRYQVAIATEPVARHSLLCEPIFAEARDRVSAPEIDAVRRQSNILPALRGLLPRGCFDEAQNYRYRISFRLGCGPCFGRRERRRDDPDLVDLQSRALRER